MSEPVGWPVAAVLGGGCWLEYFGRSGPEADGRPAMRLLAVITV